MSLVLLLHYLMLNMFWMLIHPSSRGCDLFVELFHGLYVYMYVRTYVCMYVCVCVCVCVCTHAHACMQACALRDSHKHCFTVDYLLGHSGEDHVGFL